MLETIDPEKAQCLTLGYWPQTFYKEQRKTPIPPSAWFKHVVVTMQNLTDAIAPLEGIFSITMQQSKTLAGQFAPKDRVSAIRIGNNRVSIARRSGGIWHTVMKGMCETNGRHLIVVAGRSTPSLPVQARATMNAMGFSLKHVP